MASSDYIAALKQGRRSYRTALTKGEYPYLPVLDEILSFTIYEKSNIILLILVKWNSLTLFSVHFTH